LLLTALTGGDDYELLFTALPAAAPAIASLAAAIGIAVTEIGRMEAGSGVEVLDTAGIPIPISRPGWRHS
jgi:thiamine-monophosphate kinase